MIVLIVLLGCVQGVDSPIFDVSVAEARIESLSLTSLGILGGSFAMSGTLHVVTPEGEPLSEPVAFDGAFMGFGLAFGGSVGGAVQLDLPLGGPVRGGELFETYTGTYEALTVGAGVQSLNVINEAGVHFDSTQLGLLFGVEVSYLSVDMKVVRLIEEEDPVPWGAGDSG